MKKTLNWLQEYWFLALFGAVVVVVVLGVSFWLSDVWTGKTLVVEADVIAHRYVPAYTDSGVRTEQVLEPNSGQMLPQVTYYEDYHPARFYLTVLGPDGLREYEVSPPIFQYYQNGQVVPLGRRIGGMSKKCLHTWIIER